MVVSIILEEEENHIIICGVLNVEIIGIKKIMANLVLDHIFGTLEIVRKRKEQLHGYNVLFIDFYKLGGVQNHDELVNIIREFYFE